MQCSAVVVLFSFFQPCVSLESALTEALEKVSASEVLKRVEVNARWHFLFFLRNDDLNILSRRSTFPEALILFRWRFTQYKYP